MKHKFLFFLTLSLTIAGCSSEPEADHAQKVDSIANEFVDGFYEQYPEEAQESGYPGAPADRFSDRSVAGMAAWNAKVDAWIAELDAIDVATLDGTPQAVTWMFARDRLQAIVDSRVCRMSLWNVSPTWTGWQVLAASTLALQEVDSPEQKELALLRVADLARFIDTEISNLRRGVEESYLAPNTNAGKVATQITSLIDTPVEDSPYFGPAARSDDEDFITAYRAIMADDVIPAMTRYRDYLAAEYEGRDAVGVSNNPDGEACYQASVRNWSSIYIDPEQVHRTGLAQMARIRSEMLAVAKESFGTDDLDGLLAELKTNPEYTFKSEADMLEHIEAAVARSKVAVQDWFGYVPDAEMVIVPYPAYEKNSGGGFYSAGAADGSRPGIYKVGTYNPTTISRAGQESTAFHEGYPGHHMQVSIALMNESLHSILRYLFVSGTGEGWALYTETLAGEMGLYSDAVTKLGMLSAEAQRAARLVVDPGMHVMGWTRQQAIDYMLENTALGVDNAIYEIDRYAAVPGQATSYLLGSLEIQRLRAHAEQLLGERFDIKAFHDRVLENGSITLPMLATSVDAWIEEQLQ
jgi:uncharacterized protein (DUF885 family)